MLRYILILVLLPAFIKSEVAFTAISGYMNRPYIGFRHMLSNLRSNFVADVGAFRGERRGTYFFSLTALSDQKGCRISLRKNRIPLVTTFASDIGFQSTTVTVVVPIQKGDVVYPYVEEGAIYESAALNRAFTSFTGFFLYSETGEKVASGTGGGSIFGGLFGRSSGNVTNLGPDAALGVEDLKDDIFNRLKTNVNKIGKPIGSKTTGNQI